MPFSKEGTGTATFVVAAADVDSALIDELPAAPDVEVLAAGAAPNEKVAFLAADSPVAVPGAVGAPLTPRAGAGVLAPLVAGVALAAGLPKENPPAAGAAGVEVPEAGALLESAGAAGLAPKLKPPVVAGFVDTQISPGLAYADIQRLSESLTCRWCWSARS